MSLVPKIGDLTSTGSQFRRNIARIASGAIVSQMITLGAMPVLTRLYHPEDFGALAVFTALYAVLGGLFSLKYDVSIILPRTDRAAIELTALAILVSVIFSLTTLVLMGGAWLLGARVAWYYFLLPLHVVLGVTYTCAQQWGARANDYRQYARSMLMNSLVNVGICLLLSIVAAEVFGNLVVGYVAGMAAALFYLSYGTLSTHRRRALHGLPRFVRLMAAGKRYKRFPLFVLPSSLIVTLGSSAQPFMLQAMFSLREVGHYAIASRFLLIPGALIGGAVAEAFRAEFVARLRDRREVTGFFDRTLRKLLLFAVPVFGGLFLVAPPLFPAVFGSTYQDSGILARYLCLGAVAQFISQPFGYVFIATNHERLGLLVQFAVTVIPLLGLAVGGALGRLDYAILLWSLLAALVSAVMIALAYRSCVRIDRQSADGGHHA